ncbi:MAG TPA: hypothetical protein PKO06_08630 [Candidatus Ozemobacteraceae bacterium]|nr:hypothetical protein [Candidatus Ozemobacteraceae bacterium]
MSSVGAVSSQSAVAEMMKLLSLQQEQSLDLAKKLIKVGAAEKVMAPMQEGLGENLDVMA